MQDPLSFSSRLRQRLVVLSGTSAELRDSVSLSPIANSKHPREY